MHKRKIGFEIKSTSNRISRQILYFSAINESERLTGMHGWVLGFLYDNRDRDIFQKDLENIIETRKSSITNMLQTMEQNGLIVRQSVDKDARLKKIVLTQKGIDLQSRIKYTLNNFEENLIEGISNEEVEVFYKVLEKINKNLDKIGE